MTDARTVQTDSAPAAVGPYSQAVVAGDLVFCSGQVGLDPASGTLVPGDVEDQARRALTNLSAVLEAAGTSMQRVVRTTVFLDSMGDFTRVNAVYAEFFPGDSPPARATVEVAALPLGALFEVDCIALAG